VRAALIDRVFLIGRWSRHDYFPNGGQYPTECQAGHEGPGLVVVNHSPCDCKAALTQPGSRERCI
jgi:hypothetical protein